MSKDNYSYVPIKNDTESTENHNKNTTFAYYVIPNQPQSKKKLGSCCCLFFVICFLLLFFLYPRVPSVILNELKFDSYGNGTGTFNFRNNNFFNMKWKNPDIKLYWIPYDGQTVGQICYGDNNPCENGKCEIKLGEFKNNKKFNTLSLSKTTQYIKLLESTPQELACTSWMLLNPYNGWSQKLMTKGHVHAKTSVNNFGKVKVSNQYYYF